MYTILMNKDKTLVASRRIDLYEGDNLVDKIQFLFPQTYKDIDLEECIVRFNYIDLTGEECSEILVKDDELYKNRLSYRYQIDSKFTKLYGDIIYDISFSDGSDVLFHTESHMISIIPRPGSIPPEEILPEDSAGKILKDIIKLEERVEKIEKNIDSIDVNDVVKYVEQDLTEDQKKQARKNINAIQSPITTAAIGQVLIVKEIDNNGKPIEWEVSDFPKNNDILTENDALSLAIECGLVEPVMLNDNTIYTDSNGVIYTF